METYADDDDNKCQWMERGEKKIWMSCMQNDIMKEIIANTKMTVDGREWKKINTYVASIPNNIRQAQKNS